MSFLNDLGNKFLGKDAGSLAVADLNKSQADYLKSLASSNGIPDAEAKGENTMLIVAVLGSLVVASGVAFFVLRKK